MVSPPSPPPCDGASIQERADALFKNSTSLAPMVRASTTPLRTLALHYGASLVYTEELVDRSITECDRVVNERLGTVDYVRKSSSFTVKQKRKLEIAGAGPPVILRIDPEVEGGKLVYQMGTGEANLALAAAKHVERDVACVDINMGCPKKFSVSGGMGSALLSDPQRATDIIKTLRRNLSVPVTAKIRLLSTIQATIDFVKLLENAGANAIAIHAREVGDEPSTAAARRDSWRPVIESLNIPTIINGDLYTREEMAFWKNESGADGVMLARPALYNTSLFSNTGLLSKTTVIQDYVSRAVRYETNYKNVKYVVCEMMNNRRHNNKRAPEFPQVYEGGQNISKVCDCRSLKDLSQLWDVRWMESPPDCTDAASEAARKYHDDYFLKPEEYRDGAQTEQINNVKRPKMA